MTLTFPKMFNVIMGAGNTSPLVLDSPHSGTFYPADFHFICPQFWLQQTEDSFVDRLFADAPSFGIPLLKAHFTRSYIDVNRAVDDISPALVAGDMPFALQPSQRSLNGYGLIRSLCRGQHVYAGKLTAHDVMQRIEQCYYPYHSALQNLLNDAYRAYGAVWHINCHSMPSRFVTETRPDFIVGDRDGTSAEPAFTQHIIMLLQRMGYTVAHNDPYKGVEIVGRYGRPRAGSHSIQLEINRALYMDEELLEPSAQFTQLKQNMNYLVQELTRWILPRVDIQRMNMQNMAAE
jgi:N-formylglutamate deformylase